MVAKTLPVLDEIRRKKRSLGPENTKLLENAVTESIKSFVESGAMLPKMEDHAAFNPRQLMALEQKLLVHGAHDDIDDSDDNDNNNGG